MYFCRVVQKHGCADHQGDTGMDVMARTKPADSDFMSDEGDMVRRRRERLGWHRNQLAKLAGLSRDTVAAVEAGEGFRHATLTKINKVLEAEEVEQGYTTPPLPEKLAGETESAIVVIHLKNDTGEVVLRGPREDRAALVADAQQLLDHMTRQEQDDK